MTLSELLGYFKLPILRSLLPNLKLGYYPLLKLWIYPKTTCYIAKTAKVSITNSLKIGSAWKRTGFSFSNITIEKNGTLIVDEFNFHTGAFIIVNPGAILEIGSGYSNNDVEITCFNRIRIGKEVAISKGVIIRDSDNHKISNRDSDISKPIEIGDHVWIGLRAIILKGVKIGSGSIIAAGAVVTHDIPPNSLAAGIPARVIKTGVTWEL
jgi:acetyltransferase-like isoleucine patch superfamily enzyme